MTTVLTSVAQFLELLRQSGLVEDAPLTEELRKLAAPSGLPEAPTELATALVRDGLLTNFQANQLLQGKTKGFIINDRYKVLEILGAGGMGKVFLCEHILLKRMVALKILPFDQVDKPSALERFYREARALAALDHPNIVRAHDMDRDRKLHFLVMEYVDGASLHDVVVAHGPLDEVRAAHYLCQAAMGLQHAHEAGWVHRDIKPGNILVDRQGTVKILDMGLALLFQDTADDLTRMYDGQCVLGTADYLSPEQGLDSHDVDIRSDIYSLGGTLYFTLTGKPPFDDSSSLTRKLLQHQMHDPRPLREVRPEVSREMAAVVAKMMAKDPDRRYQVPIEVAEALAPWTQTPVAPLELSMTSHCAAVQNLLQSNLRPLPPGGGFKPPSDGPSSAKVTAPRTPLPRTPPPRTPRTPSRGQPRPTSRAAEEDTAPRRAEGMPTAKIVKGPRTPRKRLRPAKPSGVFRSLPRAVRRNWPVYAGASLVAAACLLLLVVWLARKHSDNAGPADDGASSAQSADGLPAVSQMPLITPAEAGRYADQNCMMEMQIKGVRWSPSGELYLDSESDPAAPGNVSVKLMKQIVLQYVQANIRDVNELKQHFAGKTIRAIGKVIVIQGRPQLFAENARHIWFAAPAQAIRPEDAARYVNVTCAVEMRVQSSGLSSNGAMVVLNSEADYRHPKNFTVVIPGTVANQLRAQGIPDLMSYYLYKTIHVNGRITLLQGRPQMQLENAEQIRLVK
jgi:serine/threonine protein kinase